MLEGLWTATYASDVSEFNEGVSLRAQESLYLIII